MKVIKGKLKIQDVKRKTLKDGIQLLDLYISQNYPTITYNLLYNKPKCDNIYDIEIEYVIAYRTGEQAHKNYKAFYKSIQKFFHKYPTTIVRCVKEVEV